jgi:hypothetical protein
MALCESQHPQVSFGREKTLRTSNARWRLAHEDAAGLLCRSPEEVRLKAHELGLPTTRGPNEAPIISLTLHLGHETNARQ